jgi:hypothetical protein
MKPLTNLNLLDTNNLLIDDEDRIFVVLKSDYRQSENRCTLEMIELTQGFVTYSVTLPIACNRDMVFTSLNDKDYKFKFYETEVTTGELSKLLNVVIRERIDKELKKQK